LSHRVGSFAQGQEHPEAGRLYLEFPL
jgi:hypothetical protein